MTWQVHPATADRFDDVAAVVDPGGNPKGCWCLAYRLTSGEFNAIPDGQRSEVLRELCTRQPLPGVLAYADGQVAGWCGMGPRRDMARLVRSRTIPRIDDVPVWSIACLVVRPAFRRQGVSEVLIAGAVDYARAQGAPCVEAYPVDPCGERISSTFAYVGTTSMFEKAGFHRVLETGARSARLSRWLMRRELD